MGEQEQFVRYMDTPVMLFGKSCASQITSLILIERKVGERTEIQYPFNMKAI